MAFSKLDNLLKTEIYIRAENMEQNFAFPVSKFTMAPSRFNSAKSSILVELQLSDTVSGVYYLPYKYLHPK